jgi:hypothetical protein
VERAEQMARGLLAHLHLSSAQASVLVDETVKPFAFQVFVFDVDALNRCPTIRTWRGHPVRLRKADDMRPHFRTGSQP